MGTAEYGASDWTIYILTIIFFALAIYTFCSISVYVIVLENFNRPKFKTVTIYTVTSQGNSPIRDNQGRCASIESVSHIGKTNPSSRAKRFKAAMLSLCVLAAAITVVHFTLERFIIGRHPAADRISLADKYVYGVVVIIVYIFFWVRQRLFYDGHSPLKHCQKQNTFLYAFSWVSLILVIVFSIVQMVLVWFWNHGSPLLTMSGYESLSWLVGCVFIQGSLLVLFIHPVWKLYRIRADFLRSRDSNFHMTSSRSGNLQRLIRRCIVFMSVSFFTDIAAVALTFTASRHPISSELIRLAFDVNVVTNTFCLIGTFTNWKTALFPWPKFARFFKREYERRKSVQSNITTVA